MKLNKIFLMAAALLAAVFASCSDDDSYSPGAQAGSYDVSFASQANQVLGKTATEFTITLHRSNGSGELTVPIEKVTVPEYCTVPEKVTFANGDTLATFKVAIASTIPFNTEYDFEIRIPEIYTHPYKAQTMYPIYRVKLTKEDYTEVGTAVLNDVFYAEAKSNIKIEYSPSFELYRIPNMFAKGYPFFFKWDKQSGSKQTFYFTDATGEKGTKFETGLKYKTHGMVSVTAYSTPAGTGDDFMGYNADENKFYLPFEWTVSAGSLGSGTIYIEDIKFTH